MPALARLALRVPDSSYVRCRETWTRTSTWHSTSLVVVTVAIDRLKIACLIRDALP